MPEDKADLKQTVDSINKRFGPNSILYLGNGKIIKVPVIPTGCLSLDYALGVGGIPRGRITELYGPAGGGKTTTSLHIVAEAQRLGGQVAYIDAEHALDPKYAARIGVDLDRMLVSQPDCGEDAIDIMASLVPVVDVVVVDSVATLVPKAEIAGESGDQFVGLHARLMGQALRKVNAIVAKSKCCLIFINQVRATMGATWGQVVPETTTGGKALKFFASVRMEVKDGAKIKDGDAVIGNRCRIKIVKNKVAPPFKECEVDLIYGEGLSREGDLLDMAASYGIVEKSGSWYSCNSERLGQGRDRAKEFLRTNTEMSKKIEELTRKAMGIEYPLMEVVN